MTEIDNKDLKILDSHIANRQNQMIDLLQEIANGFKTLNQFNEQAIGLIQAMEKVEHCVPEQLTEQNIQTPEPSQTGQVLEPEKKDGFYQ